MKRREHLTSIAVFLVLGYFFWIPMPPESSGAPTVSTVTGTVTYSQAMDGSGRIALNGSSIHCAVSFLGATTACPKVQSGEHTTGDGGYQAKFIDAPSKFGDTLLLAELTRNGSPIKGYDIAALEQHRFSSRAWQIKFISFPMLGIATLYELRRSRRKRPTR